jgi:hypothetical protein
MKGVIGRESKRALGRRERETEAVDRGSRTKSQRDTNNASPAETRRH